MCWARVLTLAMLVVGCSMDAASQPAVELGTGESHFEDLIEGQDVTLIHGPQGGWHVWMSLRAQGIEPTRVGLRVMTQVLESDLQADQQEARINLTHNEELGVEELVGWPAILSKPGCCVDRTLRVEVTLIDREGREGTASRTMVPRTNTPDLLRPCD